ncbi:MAG: hypothetical protein NC489_08215 [Ruminococcus flavefaciens]|nr:hypothetical protein [Ruminococcus flavefaciens]
MANNTTTRKSPKSTINKVEDLVVYVFQITNNDKQFPKAYRYTLVSMLRNVGLTLYVGSFLSCSKTIRSSDDAKMLLDMLQNCYNTLIQLNALLCISSKVANIRNPGHLFELYDMVDESLVQWVKATKRLHKRLLEVERARAVKHANARNDVRDGDGFVVLKRRR